ncbi:hypothetical protein [Streptomyces sp. ML-6]|uniref:hypothetical protein n=1 Tax=Streptomyces sp. ML-6 TaxID=2982693 RepID=UPI0024C0501B|nr:hypothetical protein [Streptomyces sp. ML-6]MDK0522147.1 hypothetical protein [Streptomyces sp. ML-6]
MTTHRRRPALTLARVDRLLIAAERDVAERRTAYEAARAERRRMRRLKAAARSRFRYAALRRAQPVLRLALALCGLVSFVVGMAFLGLHRPCGPELFGVTAAAWSLCAAVPRVR